MNEHELIRKVRKRLVEGYESSIEHNDPRILYSVVGYVIGMIDTDGLNKGTDTTPAIPKEEMPLAKKTFEDFVKEVKDKGGVLTSDGYSNKENLENYRTMSLREEIYTRIAVKEHANMLWRQCCGYGINNMIGLVEWFDDPSHTRQNMKDISTEDYKTLLDIYCKGCRRPEDSMGFYDYLLYIARVMNISKSSATRTCNALAKSNIYTVRQLKYYCKEHNIGNLKNIGNNGIMLCKYILTHD